MDRSIPLATNPFPRLGLASVNQRIAPIRTTITPETLPIKIKKSQISAKYVAIMLTKSDSGLRRLNRRKPLTDSEL